MLFFERCGETADMIEITIANMVREPQPSRALMVQAVYILIDQCIAFRGVRVHSHPSGELKSEPA
jgi:hypothetical protein